MSSTRAASPSTSLDTPSGGRAKTRGGKASSIHSKKVTDVACWPCRKRKAKCTGERPTCQSCIRRGCDCGYEYDEGLTRIGSLRMRLTEASTRADNLEYLFEQMRTLPDNEAAMLLAVIRLGADLDAIVSRLKSDSDISWTSTLEFDAANFSPPKMT